LAAFLSRVTRRPAIGVAVDMRFLAWRSVKQSRDRRERSYTEYAMTAKKRIGGDSASGRGFDRGPMSRL